MKNNLFPIANIGIKYVGVSSLIFFFCMLLDLNFLSFFVFLITLGFVFIFRNPEREIPFFEDASVVSPVDGIVSSIESINDVEYTYKIIIESSYADVGVLRTPINAKVKSLLLFRGARVSENTDLYNKMNENMSLVFENTKGNCITVKHRLKQTFSPLCIDIAEEQQLRQGVRYGVAVNATTSIYFPQNFRFNVHVGDQLKGSQTLLGYFS